MTQWLFEWPMSREGHWAYSFSHSLRKLKTKMTSFVAHLAFVACWPFRKKSKPCLMFDRYPTSNSAKASTKSNTEIIKHTADSSNQTAAQWTTILTTWEWWEWAVVTWEEAAEEGEGSAVGQRRLCMSRCVYDYDTPAGIKLFDCGCERWYDASELD